LTPLFQVRTEREFLAHSLPVKEGIAGLDRAGFSFPVDQGDTDIVPGQPVLLEERPQITLPLLPPKMHDDPPWVNLDQVELAPPDDEPDHPLWIGGVKCHQAFTGAFEDRPPCVM
jgi:hypothetical protein